MPTVLKNEQCYLSGLGQDMNNNGKQARNGHFPI